jgi:hypothetical protein
VAETPLDRLLRLDARIRPGLSEIEFTRLLAKCQYCGLIMTHRVFGNHLCLANVVREPFVIDITDDDVIDLTMDEN